MTDDINFEIVTREVFVEGKAVPKKMAIVREDNHEVLSIAGSRYKVVNHQNIIHNIDEVLQENKYVFERNDRVCKGGARIYSNYQFAGIEFNIGEADPVTLTLILKNSYDSGCKVGFNLGGHRLCSRVTLAVNKNLVSFSKSHTANFKDKDFIEKITNVIMQYGDEVIPFWNRLYQKDTPTFAGVTLIEKICEEKVFPQRYMEQILMRWSNPLLNEDKPRNLWSLYNAFVGFVQQSMEFKKYERSQELKQKLDSYFYNLI